MPSHFLLLDLIVRVSQDLTSVQNLQKKHALLEADVGSHQERIEGVQIAAEQFAEKGHFDADSIQSKRVNDGRFFLLRSSRLIFPPHLGRSREALFGFGKTHVRPQATLVGLPASSAALQRSGRRGGLDPREGTGGRVHQSRCSLRFRSLVASSIPSILTFLFQVEI